MPHSEREARMSDELDNWPLDQEQRQLIDRACRLLSDDEFASILESLEEARAKVINCAANLAQQPMLGASVSGEAEDLYVIDEKRRKENNPGLSEEPWQNFGEATGSILASKPRKIVAAQKAAKISDVAALMSRERVGAIIIRDADDDLLGIVSERDIVNGLAEHGSAVLNRVADQMMTRDVVTCTPNDDIFELMRKMTAGRFRHLPVMEDTKLLGMVSIGDVVKYQLEEKEEAKSDQRRSHGESWRNFSRLAAQILAAKGFSIVSVQRTTKVADIAELLSRERIGAVVVLGTERGLLGVVSERDIVNGLAEHGASVLDRIAYQIMARDSITCIIDDNISKLMQKINNSNCRHMPLILEEKVVGMISVGDVIKYQLEENDLAMEVLYDDADNLGAA